MFFRSLQLKTLSLVLFFLVGSCLASSNNYDITTGYVSRNEYCHHDDTTFKDEYQKEVYELARDIAKEKGYKKIVDIGCGSAFKMIKYLGDFNTVGYEIEPTLSYLKNTYPDMRWEKSDFSKTPEDLDVDLIICSDVIEHLLKPEDLIKFINKFNYKFLVLSTPDRNLLTEVYGYPFMGPPVNPYHIREWSFEELDTFISKHFVVVNHLVTNRNQATQAMVCKKK